METKGAFWGPLDKPAGTTLERGYGPLASGENVEGQSLDFLTWADLVSTGPMELVTQAVV